MGGRKTQSFVVGKTAVVAGPSKLSESTVEKFLGEKRNCNLGASLPLIVARR